MDEYEFVHVGGEEMVGAMLRAVTLRVRGNEVRHPVAIVALSRKIM